MAAFSALSGPDLLTETQRVSDAKLVDLQEQLAEQKIALDASQNDLVKSAAQLGDKEKKLNSMEKDVRRHNEKERIENEVPRLTVAFYVFWLKIKPTPDRYHAIRAPLCALCRRKSQV